jgi:hypothetical protein
MAGGVRWWTAKEVAELRRLWPRVQSGGLGAAAVAGAFGRTVHAVRAAARQYGAARRKPSLRRCERHVRRLLGAGLFASEVARRLGIRHPATVRRWARRLGIPLPAARGERFRRRCRRALRAAWLRRGVDCLAALRRDRRLAEYAARGYPPGVSSPAQAAAVDAVRARGGATAYDLGRHPCAAAATLRGLCGVGALAPAGKLACRVANRRPVTVYRPARPAAAAVPARRPAGEGA